MMPPSPATSTLVGERLNTSASPNPPTCTPSRREPNACAASKNSLTPLLAATSTSPSTSHGVPYVWVARIAEVLTPIARAAASGERVCVASSMSANVGCRPFHATACAVAANVKEGTTTPPDNPDARRVSMSPDVHEDTATQWRTPRYSAARSSSSRT